MKNSNFDVIIVGSGPAGVSAAFPLVRAGLRILMVDGGKTPSMKPLQSNFSIARHQDVNQKKFFIGKDFYSLAQRQAVSPKFRVPFHEYVFDGFLQENKIESKEIVAVGSLAVGGLSNAWGCGVAKYSRDEMINFPFDYSLIEKSYERVSRRIGISGNLQDDMSEYFGLDEYALPSIPLDAMNSSLIASYEGRQRLGDSKFKLGRSRVAALSKNYDNRQSCNLCGNCLWGCGRKSLYSSFDEVAVLREHSNFSYEPGFIVNHIISEAGSVSICGHSIFNIHNQKISSKKILLAAGTLATTAIAFRSLGYFESTRLLSNPTAAFMLWLPKFLGKQTIPGFGFGQLSYSLRISNDVNAFGSTFTSSGLPLAEFAPYVPISRRYSMRFLASFIRSCIVGNIFLPGAFSGLQVKLDGASKLSVNGGVSEEAFMLFLNAKNILKKEFSKLGAYILPGSFIHGIPGSDIHYAGTMPMSRSPILGETSHSGEIFGLNDVHIIDGASLPSLSEKSHTLTIMANADRIANVVLKNFKRDC